jgi:hypothetical protein
MRPFLSFHIDQHTKIANKEHAPLVFTPADDDVVPDNLLNHSATTSPGRQRWGWNFGSEAQFC